VVKQFIFSLGRLDLHHIIELQMANLCKPVNNSDNVFLSDVFSIFMGELADQGPDYQKFLRFFLSLS
jgi:hypothetical protein